MSALVINGMVAPVTTDSPGLTWVEHGSRGRSGSGRAALQRVAFIRRLTGGMSWQRREEAVAWAALLMGQGDVWHYDLSSGVAVTTSSKGRAAASSPTAVVSTRASEIIAESTSTEYTHPKFGDGCIAIEDALTNLATADVARGAEDANGSASSLAQFIAVAGASVASSTSYAWQGSRSVEVTCASASDGVRVADLAAASAVQHAASVYLRVASGTLNVTVNFRNETTTTDGATKTVTLNTSWKRVEVLSPASVSVSDNLRLIITAAAAGVFYVDGVQLEARDFSTTWAVTTRSAGALAYTLPMVRPTDDLTVMFWARVPAAVADADTAYGWTLGTTTDNVFMRLTGGAWGAGVTVASSVTAYSDGHSFGDWVHLAVTMRRNPQTGSAKVAFYYDGTDSGISGSPTTLPTWTSAPTLRVGADASGNNRWNGLIDDLVVLPFALGATELAAYVAASRAWSNLPALDCYGDLLPGTSSASPLAMVGLPPRLATVAARQGSATTTEVNHAVSFELEEDAPEGY